MHSFRDADAPTADVLMNFVTLRAKTDFDHFVTFSLIFDLSALKVHLQLRGGFNGRPLVQWPTRPLGGWALETPGPRGPRKAKFWLAIAKS